MGEYLKTRFQQAVRKARRLGLKVNLYPRSEVVDLREEGDKAYLVVKSLVSGKSYSRMLNAELEVAYGRPIDWEDILSPKDSPRDLLRRYLKDSRDGDGPGGEIIWQTVLHQAFPISETNTRC